MELNRIEELLEKYFEGSSNEEEEQVLKVYFSQEKVAAHLQQYQSMFGYFSKAKTIESKRENSFNDFRSNKKKRRINFSVAASVLVLIGVGMFMYMNYLPINQEDLGTYDDPKIALQETQKALSLLSSQVNKGYESVQYIEEYEKTRDKIFNLN